MSEDGQKKLGEAPKVGESVVLKILLGGVLVVLIGFAVVSFDKFTPDPKMDAALLGAHQITSDFAVEACKQQLGHYLGSTLGYPQEKEMEAMAFGATLTWKGVVGGEFEEIVCVFDKSKGVESLTIDGEDKPIIVAGSSKTSAEKSSADEAAVGDPGNGEPPIK